MRGEWRLGRDVTQAEIDQQADTGEARWQLRQTDGHEGYAYDSGTIARESRVFVGRFWRDRTTGTSRAILPIDAVCDEVEWKEA